MKKILIFFIIFFNYNLEVLTMENKPYHHLENGRFRNPEGSPVRDMKFNWSYKIFNEEKKKLNMNVPDEHVISKDVVIKSLKDNEDKDYIFWIGHATFVIKLGETTIITDPVFEYNMGPLIFGPKRFVDPAIKLNELPNIDLFLLTHNHYDHLSTRTIQRFPYKNAKVATALNLGKYFTKNGFKDVSELDWYDQIMVNDIKITFLPAVHWSKRSLWDTNKTLWGSFLIEYKGKKLFFACDTGYGEIYKYLGQKYGPIDLTFINIGAYNFYPIMPYKDKSTYHTNPEEALEIAQNLKSKKVIGMHWGTFVLSLEPIMEPPKRFKASANKYGFKKEDVLIYKIGEFDSLKKLLNYN